MQACARRCVLRFTTSSSMYKRAPVQGALPHGAPYTWPHGCILQLAVRASSERVREHLSRVYDTPRPATSSAMNCTITSDSEIAPAPKCCQHVTSYSCNNITGGMVCRPAYVHASSGTTVHRVRTDLTESGGTAH